MDTNDKKTQWADGKITAALLLGLLLVLGITGRLDYAEAQQQQEAARQLRELVMAAKLCGPKPGQRSLQEWRDGRIYCAIWEGNAYAGDLQLVATADTPALSHPLSGEE